MLGVLLVVATTSAKEGPPEPEAIAMTIIQDTSPSVKNSWDVFAALRRQAISTLLPGDYIELRAEMDIYWVLSACVLPSANSGDPSPLLVETYSRRSAT